MPIREIVSRPEGELYAMEIVEVVDVLYSRDGSAKLIQAVNSGPIRVTFETGRYLVDREEKVCLSSQIGCTLRCSFCVSGQPFEYISGNPQRKFRDLTVDEIFLQAQNALRIVPPTRSEDLVFAFMGMGDPFANLTAVKQSIHFLGSSFPHAKVTLSTIGHNLVGIRDLADEIASRIYPIPVRLHVSLHGSSDASRQEIVPFAKPLTETLDASEYFSRTTDQQVKLNYVLVSGMNASADDAHQIGALLKDRSGLILKISDLNASDTSSCNSANTDEAEEFERIVRSYGVSTCRFVSLGTDIHAGCGELAKGMNPETVLGYIQRPDGKILMLQRGPTSSYPSQWSILSGKVKRGEKIPDALERELNEELRILLSDLTTSIPLSPVIYSAPDSCSIRYTVHPFSLVLSDDSRVVPDGREVIAIRWIDPIEILSLDIVPPLREEIVLFRKTVA